MKPGTLILALVVVTSPASVRAETAAQRAACTSDAWKLCSAEIPNIEGIKACLIRERAKLSAACRIVMDEASKPKQTLVSDRR